MAEITSQEILLAAQKLNPQQKALLAQSLEMPPPDMGPTREELIAELEALRASGLLTMWRVCGTSTQTRHLMP